MSDVHYKSRNMFLFGEPSGLFDEITQLESAPGILLPALLAFKSSLLSVITVGNIPYLLAHRAIYMQDYNAILSAERIRTLKPGPGRTLDDPPDEVLARTKARAIFDQRLQQAEAQQVWAKETLSLLDAHLTDADFESASVELLRQMVVMVWSAFEVLVNDSLRELLNGRPAVAGAIARSKLYREYFAERRLLDALEDNGFNLSGLMGDFFCDSVRLDSLEKIREAVETCFSDANLERLLKDQRLWLLAQQRHLVVHRRGRVDARYIEKTGDNATIGEHLRLKADYVEGCLLLVRDVGCAFYRVASAAAASA